MTDLEKSLIGALKTAVEGWGSLSWDNTNIKDMTRKELELLCLLLGHQVLVKKPIITVSLKNED